MSDVESIILASTIAACAAELLTGFLDLGKNRIHFRFQAGYGARTWRYWSNLRFLILQISAKGPHLQTQTLTKPDPIKWFY